MFMPRRLTPTENSECTDDFTQITFLLLQDFGRKIEEEDEELEIEWFSYNTFIKLLSIFPNLEKLDLLECYINFDDANEWPLNVLELHPNLTCFSYNNQYGGDVTFLEEIIDQFAPLLRSLHFVDAVDIVIPSDTSFTNLEELSVSCIESDQIINQILSKTNTLKRVNITTIYESVPYGKKSSICYLRVNLHWKHSGWMMKTMNSLRKHAMLLIMKSVSQTFQVCIGI